MRLRHIEVFNAVMLTGSVSGAARLINVTQPAVSRTLQHAEIQLGFALFQRTKNRLVPSSEALALYPHIERLFADLEDVQRLAATLKACKDLKEIRVVSILALGHEVLPRAVKVFSEKFPDVGVTFKALHSPQIVSALVLQEADVGFLYSPAAHPALSQESLGHAAIMCVAPKGMLPAKVLKKNSVTLQELARLQVIGLDTTDPLGLTLGAACRDAGVGLSSRITVQTYHAALALAHHGLGVALVDGCTALSANPALADVVPLEPGVPVPIHALRPAGRPSSVAIRFFTRAVQQVLAEALTPAAPSRKRG
ncbi:MAG: LysR family transcriptional regulator [Burkholderiales bacterium]|nr:LysR family transcriptional regulator [Burkholderiales bacterium]